MGTEGLAKEFAKIFLDIAKEHGEFVGLSVMVLLFFGSLLVYLMRTTIKTYKSEIERLAGEKNKLLDVLLNERKSSLENGGTQRPEGAKKDE